jgi:putative ABC transport system substrate-binding protein
MRRRHLIALLAGAAAARPSTAGAQERAIPLIGFLDPRFPEDMADRLRGFREGLSELRPQGGEPRIEYRWA